MDELKTILAFADLATSNSVAARRGALLAEALGARLELQAVVHEPEYSGDIFPLPGPVEMGQRAALESARRRLEALADRLPLSHDRITVSAVWGHPFHRAVLDQVASHQPDLVVLTPRLGGRGRLTHAEWRLVSLCPVPLMIARLDHWQEPPRIFAGVDPAHPGEQQELLDRTILQWAGRVAAAFASDYAVVHAIGEIPSSTSIVQSPAEYEAEVRQSRQQQIEARITPDYRPREVRLVAQEPAEALCAASGPSDLAVMGALKRSRLQDLLVGSIARDTVARLACDVLIVKPPQD